MVAMRVHVRCKSRKYHVCVFYVKDLGRSCDDCYSVVARPLSPRPPPPPPSVGPHRRHAPLPAPASAVSARAGLSLGTLHATVSHSAAAAAVTCTVHLGWVKVTHLELNILLGINTGRGVK